VSAYDEHEIVDLNALVAARKELLSAATKSFAADPNVVGVFLGGSLAAGSADAYSDIDLRVVVKSGSHADFVARRREIPRAWSGFLFDEWMSGAQHCVSHFRPFGKIDIFYLDGDALKPSPWYGLPIKILHDPLGVVAALVAHSKDLSFTTPIEDVERSISKGLAAAHEAYRRASRDELLHAQTLLHELRHHVMKADDWLQRRTPLITLYSKFEHRGSQDALMTLAASFCVHDATAIKVSLALLVGFYRRQVVVLHEKFPLSRPLENDLIALDIIS
jgi:predicted nucleotidyltransferase